MKGEIKDFKKCEPTSGVLLHMPEYENPINEGFMAKLKNRYTVSEIQEQIILAMSKSALPVYITQDHAMTKDEIVMSDTMVIESRANRVNLTLIRKE